MVLLSLYLRGFIKWNINTIFNHSDTCSAFMRPINTQQTGHIFIYSITSMARKTAVE